MIVTQEALDEIALSSDEYSRIVKLLGREPTDVELGMFGAMWSEHCGYKNSKALLRRLPTTGPRRWRSTRATIPAPRTPVCPPVACDVISAIREAA